MKWNVPSFAKLRNTHLNGTLAVCGGGPSMADTIDELKELRRRGAYILSVNKTNDFLVDNGIVPDYHALLDPMDWVADYVKKPQARTKFLIASQCHRDVYRKLKGQNCYLWHCFCDFYGVNYPSPILEKDYMHRDWISIPGPTTVGMRSVYLGQSMGFRYYHLFGMDSSMVDGKLHAYEKAKPTDAKEGWYGFYTQAGEQKFYSNEHMARQVSDFDDMMDQFALLVKEGRIKAPHFTVHGSGMLPTYAARYGWHASKAMNDTHEFRNIGVAA